jgi:ribosomal-protein-alanine N-acetyltransferase
MVSNIVHGAQRSGVIGYWVSEHVAGRGIAPAAVAMTVDHCFDTLLMHRLELCIRPENAASLRVAAKLGLRSEGLRPRYIHIAGRWRDHQVFAVTSEEVPQPGGMLERLRRITPV